MNKLVSCLIAFTAIIILLFPHTAIASESEIKVIINGKKLNMDVPPVIENGRTLVPFRALFEAFGVDVEWNSADKSISSITKTKKGHVVRYIFLTIGSKEAIISNQGKRAILDTPPIIKDNRTMVPLRFVSEALDMDVKWDGITKTVNIINKEFRLGDGGFVVRTQGTSSKKSEIEFLELKDYAEDSKYLMALGEDGKLYTISKSDLKHRLISKMTIYNLESFEITYYNGKFYYIDHFKDGDKTTYLVKKTDGEKETDYSCNFGSTVKIKNRLYFANTSKYQGICGLKYIDMDTDKEFTITDSEYFQLLYSSSDNVFYITFSDKGSNKYQADFHLRTPDNENMDKDKIIRTLDTNKKLYNSIQSNASGDLYFFDLVKAESTYIFYDLGIGIYCFDPMKKDFIKISEINPRQVYYADNKLYLITQSEIGYIDLNNNYNYSKLFSMTKLFSEGETSIDEIDDEGNVIFTLSEDVGMQHFKRYKYKYLIKENKVMLIDFTPGRLLVDSPDIPVGTMIDVDN